MINLQINKDNIITTGALDQKVNNYWDSILLLEPLLAYKILNYLDKYYDVTWDELNTHLFKTLRLNIEHKSEVLNKSTEILADWWNHLDKINWEKVKKCKITQLISKESITIKKLGKLYGKLGSKPETPTVWGYHNTILTKQEITKDLKQITSIRNAKKYLSDLNFNTRDFQWDSEITKQNTIEICKQLSQIRNQKTKRLVVNELLMSLKYYRISNHISDGDLILNHIYPLVTYTKKEKELITNWLTDITSNLLYLKKPKINHLHFIILTQIPIEFRFRVWCNLSKDTLYIKPNELAQWIIESFNHLNQQDKLKTIEQSNLFLYNYLLMIITCQKLLPEKIIKYAQDIFNTNRGKAIKYNSLPKFYGKEHTGNLYLKHILTYQL